MKTNMKKSVVETIDNLHYEVESSRILLNELDFETDMGKKISIVTRIKILNEMLYLFNKIKNLNRKGNEVRDEKIKEEILIDHMRKLNKRCKLHFFQLDKLREYNYDSNYIYFTLIIKLLYSFCLKKLR
tara:strand:- start:57 stop:443 length:387 start_codon:yes stop_codon:yes gene_type:complete